MVKRVFVLYSRMAPYMTACLQRLKALSDCTINGVVYPKDPDAPLQLHELDTMGTWHNRNQLTETDILRLLGQFGPDVILASGWVDSVYCRALRKLRGECLRVGFCDTQYRGDLRQWIARLARSRLQQQWFDVMWVSGERQAVYARTLGFHGNRLWQGCYACQQEVFAAARATASARRQEFLYVGRLVEAKAIDVLKQAYRQYRSMVMNPWALVCIGTGSLRTKLEHEEGVHMKGFVQPNALPAAMSKANVFVLPSRFEPWGVVLQEAAALGLPLIATEACGATAHLLCDGWNGFLAETGNPDALAKAMARMHATSQEELNRMGEASFQLSRQFTSDLWARTLLNGYQEWQTSRC